MLKRFGLLVGTALTIALILLSCCTAPIPFEESTIQAEESGFAPPQQLTIDLHFGNREYIRSWTVRIMGNGLTPKSWIGKATNLPPFLTWDGKFESGASFADPGTYIATLIIEYEKTYLPVVRVSQSFVFGASKNAFPPTPGDLSIKPRTKGFSSKGEPTVMVLALTYGQPSAVTRWMVTIGSAASGVVRKYSGTAKDLPTTLSWDGTTDLGTLATDDSYMATLSVSYGTTSQASVTSSPFLLVTTPPDVEISQPDPLFFPIKESKTITFTITARSKNAAIASGSVDICDQARNVLRHFDLTWPINNVTWDGTSSDGDLVQSIEDYPVIVKVRDEFGNIGELDDVVHFAEAEIFFMPSSATPTLNDVWAPNLLDVLTHKIATLIKRFPGYQIRLVGHANPIGYPRPEGKSLYEYSMKRAGVIAQALETQGISAVIIFPDSKEKQPGEYKELMPYEGTNSWKNRRVEVFFEKK